MIVDKNERPIIMGEFSVCRINTEPLPSKTQTRRVVKIDFANQVEFDGKEYWCEDKYGDHHKAIEYCPYGRPGDLLWVKETYGLIEGVEQCPWPDMPHKLLGAYPEANQGVPIPMCVIWKASFDRAGAPKWRPSLFMPKWAARTTLEIVDRRVQKVQNISDEDIKAEGIDLFDLSICDNFFGKYPVKNASFPHWISGHEGQSGEVFCKACALKEAEKTGKEWCVDGGWDGAEEDGQRFCDKCGDMLDVNYSNCGIEQEVGQFENNPVRDSIDVSSIMTVLSTTNDFDRDYPELASKLRRICFRELWNRLNAAPKPVRKRGKIVHYVSYPWEDVTETKEFRGKPWHVMGNPLVWAVTFKKIEANPVLQCGVK